jgi:four helix bundle protein
VANSRFTDLVAYRIARELADQLHAEAISWESFDRWSIGIQMVRAVDSIGANIAEAFGRSSTADIRRLLFIARGSAFEMEHWIDAAGSRGLLDATTYEARLQELARTLNGLIRRPGPRA